MCANVKALCMQILQAFSTGVGNEYQTAFVWCPTWSHSDKPSASPTTCTSDAIAESHAGARKAFVYLPCTAIADNIKQHMQC